MGRVEQVGGRIENIVINIDTLSGHLAGIFGKVKHWTWSIGKLINDEKYLMTSERPSLLQIKPLNR